MPDAVGELPPDAGAYVLLISLSGSLSLDLPTFRGDEIGPGFYAYCGSAFGPGGIRARVSRHLGDDKALRWHVDHLTAAGRVAQVGVRIGGRECDLVETFLVRGGAAVLPGFGSSDCRLCAAHLLRLPVDGKLPEEIFDLVVSRGL